VHLFVSALERNAELEKVHVRGVRRITDLGTDISGLSPKVDYQIELNREVVNASSRPQVTSRWDSGRSFSPDRP
jgi:hypothetical protein